MDVEIHLKSMGLGKTIARGNNATNQSRAKAMIFLRHHIDEGLKMEYLTVENPLDLWNKLKERYDNLKLIVLPKAHNEWHNLRLQDFKSVTEYNSALVQNHFTSAYPGRGNNKGRRYDIGQKCDRPQPRRNNGKKPYKPLKWQNDEQKRNHDYKCHKYGTKGHWSRVCRTPKHLADLYQALLKGKNMSADVNLSEQNNDDAYDDVLKNTSADINLAEQNNDDIYDDILNSDLMHHDTADFLEHPEGAK
ncbi:uncharacterized protein LOC127263611 [Andrographis paniculata]|uniref:uncharacterized protein LOC127263611 n=1 Tax=Andrographis paniculata TaxID=175694 RepID=UPI0021E93DB8|nr:uncharacterized protein LOC127263611 [Andrographis paniculata]